MKLKRKEAIEDEQQSCEEEEDMGLSMVQKNNFSQF